MVQHKEIKMNRVKHIRKLETWNEGDFHCMDRLSTQIIESLIKACQNQS